MDENCGHGSLSSGSGNNLPFTCTFHSLTVLSICDFTNFATVCIMKGGLSVRREIVSMNGVDCVQKSVLRLEALSSAPF